MDLKRHIPIDIGMWRFFGYIIEKRNIVSYFVKK